MALALCPASLAGAQTPDDSASGTTAGVDAEIVALEARNQEQNARLVQQVQEVSDVGQDLQETQAQVEGAVIRSRELSVRAGKLEDELESQQQTYIATERRYKQQVRAAYKGDSVEGLVGILATVLDPGEDSNNLTRAQVRDVLLKSHQRIEDYRGARQKVKNTRRQVASKRSDYQEALEEERVRVEELRQKERELEASVSRIRAGKARTGDRVQQLQAAERERILATRPATGGAAVQREQELRIARDEIVARPVEPIPKKQYRKLYRESAKKYGFGRDWYVLAAVGKVESNHGENMGPSSAGALGPMQFMPSTWESSGVDGNGDGVANVMDPRDAIPAAAKYLKTGGAPGDWYAALYSYNHADWYVKKVQGVAEGYRRLAKDSSTGPYV